MPQRDRLVYNTFDSLILRLIGLPILFMGLISVFGTLQGDTNFGLSGLLEAVVSIAITSAGGGMVFGRSGVVVDRSRGIAQSWWGLLVPIRTKTFELDSFDRVEIFRGVTGGGKSSPSIVYPVCLVGKEPLEGVEEGEDADRILCFSDRSYELSIAKAEELAEFTNLELHDTTTGQEVVRGAESLDDSILEQVEKSGDELQWPVLPNGSVIHYETVDEGAIINIPLRGFGAAHVLLLTPALFVTSSLLTDFLESFFGSPADAPPGFGLVVFGIWALFTVAMVVAMIGPILQMSSPRERISVSWRGIEIERSWGLGLKFRWTIKGDELKALEISYDDPQAFELMSLPDAVVSVLRMLSPASRIRGVRTRSDDSIVTIGRALSVEELRWLHGALRYILASRPSQ